MVESLYLLKPDGYKHRKQINNEISKFALFKSCIDIKLTKELVSSLYPYDAKQNYFNDILDYLCEGLSQVNVIDIDSYNSLCILVGHDRDPKKCDPSSLRFRFGEGTFEKNGIIVYKNAMHRTKNEKEFKNDYKIFKHLF